jgi:hypothetical chaperone protein
MFAGIDFGTSNCLLGIWRDGKADLLKLEDDKCELPSNLFVSRSEVAEQRINESELARRLSEAQREQAATASRAKQEGRAFQALDAAALESMLRQTMSREQLATAQNTQSAESANVALRRGNRCEFGAAAQEHFMSDPEAGHLVKSPKTFLGSDLRTEQLNFFKDVSASILGFMKNKAETQLETSIEKVVLGRPVHFHGTKGAASDRQAEDLLRSAAEQVGFKDIEFMLEPIAAALHFEQNLTKDMQVLVLDIGGGTTDCSMINVGPSHRQHRREALLGYYAGRRSGGVELDIQLAINKLMPALGRGRCAVPDQVYWDAAKVNDIPAQSRFLSATRGHELEMHFGRAPADEKRLIARLLELHSSARTLRLNRSAELAKIQLTDHERCHLALDYLEDELAVDISRDEFRAAIARNIESFLQLVIEVENQAGTKPDLVYVTGGTAKSPIVQHFLNSNLAGYPIEYGNLFGSVGSGLTAWAGQIFR